jgi:hypothetical protein
MSGITQGPDELSRKNEAQSKFVSVVVGISGSKRQACGESFEHVDPEGGCRCRYDDFESIVFGSLTG